MILGITENKIELKLDKLSLCIESVITAKIMIEMDQIQLC